MSICVYVMYWLFGIKISIRCKKKTPLFTKEGIFVVAHEMQSQIGVVKYSRCAARVVLLCASSNHPCFLLSFAFVKIGPSFVRRGAW